MSIPRRLATSGRTAAGEPVIGQAPGGLAKLQAFVNTLDVEEQTDQLDSPAALDRWLARAGLAADLGGPDGGPGGAHSSPSGPQQLFLALELREALRGILRSHVTHSQQAPAAAAPAPPGARGPDPVRRLRVIAAALPAQLEVGPDGSVAPAPAGFGALAGLARIMLIAAEAATLGTWSRLKVCSADDCQWAFYDRSPTRSGCWCSMQICGSRSKARSYRRRRLPPTASRSGRTAAQDA